MKDRNFDTLGNLYIKKNKDSANDISIQITQKVGTIYRSKREQLGKTINSLAKELGIGVTTISELEKGYNFPKLETVIYIGLCLGFEFKEIISIMMSDHNSKITTSKKISVTEILELLKQEHDADPEMKKIQNEMAYYRYKIESISKIHKLNKAGEDIVLEFVNFISSQSKYQSGSAYSKRKNKK